MLCRCLVVLESLYTEECQAMKRFPGEALSLSMGKGEGGMQGCQDGIL